MRIDVIDAWALLVISVLIGAVLTFAWLTERGLSRRRPPIEDVDIDDLTDPEIPVFESLSPEPFVAAIPTPIPFVDTELRRCPWCGTPISSLSADDCIMCGAEFDGTKGAA